MVRRLSTASVGDSAKVDFGNTERAETKAICRESAHHGTLDLDLSDFPGRAVALEILSRSRDVSTMRVQKCTVEGAPYDLDCIDAHELAATGTMVVEITTSPTSEDVALFVDMFNSACYYIQAIWNVRKEEKGKEKDQAGGNRNMMDSSLREGGSNISLSVDASFSSWGGGNRIVENNCIFCMDSPFVTAENPGLVMEQFLRIAAEPLWYLYSEVLQCMRGLLVHECSDIWVVRDEVDRLKESVVNDFDLLPRVYQNSKYHSKLRGAIMQALFEIDKICDELINQAISDEVASRMTSSLSRSSPASACKFAMFKLDMSSATEQELANELTELGELEYGDERLLLLFVTLNGTEYILSTSYSLPDTGVLNVVVVPLGPSSRDILVYCNILKMIGVVLDADEGAEAQIERNIKDLMDTPIARLMRIRTPALAEFCDSLLEKVKALKDPRLQSEKEKLRLEYNEFSDYFSNIARRSRDMFTLEPGMKNFLDDTCNYTFARIQVSRQSEMKKDRLARRTSTGAIMPSDGPAKGLFPSNDVTMSPSQIAGSPSKRSVVSLDMDDVRTGVDQDSAMFNDMGATLVVHGFRLQFSEVQTPFREPIFFSLSLGSPDDREFAHELAERTLGHSVDPIESSYLNGEKIQFMPHSFWEVPRVGELEIEYRETELWLNDMNTFLSYCSRLASLHGTARAVKERVLGDLEEEMGKNSFLLFRGSAPEIAEALLLIYNGIRCGELENMDSESTGTFLDKLVERIDEKYLSTPVIRQKLAKALTKLLHQAGSMVDPVIRPSHNGIGIRDELAGDDHVEHVTCFALDLSVSEDRQLAQQIFRSVEEEAAKVKNVYLRNQKLEEPPKSNSIPPFGLLEFEHIPYGRCDSDSNFFLKFLDMIGNTLERLDSSERAAQYLSIKALLSSPTCRLLAANSPEIIGDIRYILEMVRTLESGLATRLPRVVSSALNIFETGIRSRAHFVIQRPKSIAWKQAVMKGMSKFLETLLGAKNAHTFDAQKSVDCHMSICRTSAWISAAYVRISEREHELAPTVESKREDSSSKSHLNIVASMRIQSSRNTQDHGVQTEEDSAGVEMTSALSSLLGSLQESANKLSNMMSPEDLKVAAPWAQGFIDGNEDVDNLKKLIVAANSSSRPSKVDPSSNVAVDESLHARMSTLDLERKDRLVTDLSECVRNQRNHIDQLESHLEHEKGRVEYLELQLTESRERAQDSIESTVRKWKAISNDKDDQIKKLTDDAKRLEVNNDNLSSRANSLVKEREKWRSALLRMYEEKEFYKSRLGAVAKPPPPGSDGTSSQQDDATITGLSLAVSTAQAAMGLDDATGPSTAPERMTGNPHIKRPRPQSAGPPQAIKGWENDERPNALQVTATPIQGVPKGSPTSTIVARPPSTGEKNGFSGDQRKIYNPAQGVGGPLADGHNTLRQRPVRPASAPSKKAERPQSAKMYGRSGSTQKMARPMSARSTASTAAGSVTSEKKREWRIVNGVAVFTM